MLAQRLKRLAADLVQLTARASVRDYSIYARDPVGYARDILGVEPWAKQREIAELLLTPPYKVLVKSAHSVGKSWTSAWLTSWWYDTFDPSVVITTAPTHRDVCDILWTEVRLQRLTACLGGFAGPKAPELWSSNDHYAKGFTAAKGESFMGRHRRRMMFVMDEAVGIEPVFWTTTKSMFQPRGEHAWLCLFNPTDPTSQAWQEEQTGNWHVVTMSALDHPNIPAQLAGKRGPYPEAVSALQFGEWVNDWFTPVSDSERNELDIEWPPASGNYFRPGPEGEARALGRWPSQGSYSVWSEGLWQLVLKTRHEIKPHWPVQIGCDVARFGDDRTAIHVRQGLCSLLHESHNGWDTKQTANRLKELCHRYGSDRLPEKRIPVLIDVGGIGGGVVDQRDEYNFIGISSCATEGHTEERYRNVRSELWFAAADLAKKGLIDVSRLGKREQLALSRQLMSVRYDLDPADRREVEDKAITKKRIKRSPDDADCFNLCFLPFRPASDSLDRQRKG